MLPVPDPLNLDHSLKKNDLFHQLFFVLVGVY